MRSICLAAPASFISRGSQSAPKIASNKKRMSTNCSSRLCSGGLYGLIETPQGLAMRFHGIQRFDVEAVDEFLVLGVMREHRGDGGRVEYQHGGRAGEDRDAHAAI